MGRPSRRQRVVAHDLAEQYPEDAREDAQRDAPPAQVQRPADGEHSRAVVLGPDGDKVDGGRRVAGRRRNPVRQYRGHSRSQVHAVGVDGGAGRSRRCLLPLEVNDRQSEEGEGG